MATLTEGAAKQRTRIAKEQIYGIVPNPASWLQLNDVKIVPAPQFESDPFAPGGSVVPTLTVINDDYTTADVTGRASYTGLFAVLLSLLGQPTSTLLAGSTWQHVWTWNGEDDIDPATFVVDYGSGRRARRFLGGFFNNLSLGIGRGGLDFKSGMMGKETNLMPTLGGMTLDVEAITITAASGGTWTFSFGGQTTAPIAYNAAPAAAQTAISALSSIGGGNVDVIAGTGGATYQVTYKGKFAGKNVTGATVSGAGLTGTGAAAAITSLTPGADSATQIAAVPIFPGHFDVFCDDSWTAMQASSSSCGGRRT